MPTVTLTIPEASKKNFKIKVADSFFSRFLGLMGKKELPADSGLMLKPCSSIHMMFMRFPIDVIFFDKCNRVVKTAQRLRPWTGFSMAPRAYGVIELPADTLKALPDIAPGTALTFTPAL